MLDTYAAGIAPKPLRRRTDGTRAVIVMSRVGGMPLGSQPLSDDQTGAVAAAISIMHAAVPDTEVAKLPVRVWCASEAVTQLRKQTTQTADPRSFRVRQALEAGQEWIRSPEATQFADEQAPLAFGQGDGNLANFMWDGIRCRIVDFEDCGASDRAFEVADLLEHVSTWMTGAVAAENLLQHLDLDASVKRRLLQARKVIALYWLIMLLPGHPGHDRNPLGSVELQARRLLQLLD